MPGQFIAELFLRAVFRVIFEFVLHVLAYGTGYFLLDTFSMGKIKIAPLDSYREKSRGKEKWYQFDRSMWLNRRGKGKKKRKELRAEITCLVGVLFWLAILIGGILFANRSDGAVDEVEMLERHSE